MGSKIESKRLMAAAGVPVLAERSPEDVTADDLPVLIKASAGGGGRGMRVVRALADLPAEAEAARAEALSAFGDATVFCEPYLATGRHIEVQVLADEHGTVWAVGERECSIQRRHQKVVEEAPSPLVERLSAEHGDGMRTALFDAARAAAAAVGYTGAGTVEFIADEQGRFYFLEMNTRLQVEHPVTECTTGLDLVAGQLAVAQGARLAPRRRRRAGTPSRCGSTPRTRPPTGGRSPACCTRCTCPAWTSSSAPAPGTRACAWTRAWSTARSSASTTTRCWPSSSRGHRRASRRPAHSPARWPAPASTAW